MAIPFLNNITLNNNEIQNVKLHNTGSIPSPAAGHIYFDTDDNIAKYYNGSVWIDIVANSNDFLTGLSFNTSDGILTATVQNQANVTVDLDNRYALATDIPANIVETVTTTDGTYINLTPNTAVDGDVTVTADLSAADGTAAVGERYLTKNNTWAEVATIPGTYTWTIAGDNSSELVSSGDTITFTGGPNCSTSYSSGSNTLTINSDNTTYDLSVPTGTTAIRLDATGPSSFDDVTISGTANEVDITRIGNQELRIGLPNDVTIAGNLTVSGTTTTNNVETVSTSNGVIFEGNAADGNELTLLAGTLTADRTITLPDATGTVALTSQLHDAVTLAGSYDYITLSGQQLTLNQIDYTTDIANIPAIPVPNNATITVSAGGGLTGGGDFTTDQAVNETITVSHADTSSQASVDNSGTTVIQDVTLDTYGHVTGLASVDLTSGINSLIDTKISATGYAATITDSVSGTTFNHGLGDDVIVQLYDATTKETVYADVERNGNYLNITFASTPANSIRVLVQQIN